MTGVYWASVAWGDYDNDGDLDILLAGNNNGTRIAKVYRNSVSTANTIPGTPSDLAAVVGTNQVTLSWTASSDAETPAPRASPTISDSAPPPGESRSFRRWPPWSRATAAS